MNVNLQSYKKMGINLENLSDGKKRKAVIKKLNKYYNDLEEIEIIKRVIKNYRESMENLKSVASDVESIQGGGSKQEDIIVNTIDKVKRLENKIFEIILDNADIINALDNIEDNEAKQIIKDVWFYKKESMETIGRKLNMGKKKVWNISNKTLCSMYDFIGKFNVYKNNTMQKKIKQKQKRNTKSIYLCYYRISNNIADIYY